MTQFMTRFHEGQEVEVQTPRTHGPAWRRAKIEGMHGERYLVKFADGTFADFDAEHIRRNGNDPVP